MVTSAAAMPSLEEAVLQLGTAVFEEVRQTKVSLFDAEFYTGKLITWAMADEGFRTALFRFVDVLPSLASSADVIRHAQEYFRPVQHRLPGVLQFGLDLPPESLLAKPAAAAIKSQVRGMAERFIVGETPEKALGHLRGIRRDGLAFTVDLLGEAAVSESESETYRQRYLELLRVLAREVPKWSESKPLVAGHPGEASPVNVSVKLSALYSQTKPVAAEKSVAVLSERLASIVRAARDVGAFVYVDMEDTRYTGLTLEVVQKVFSLPDLRDYPRVGCVLQTYLRRTEGDLRQLLAWLPQRGTPMAVRLVKGAYWDTETIQARLEGWPIPVWQEKQNSDATYEKLAALLLDHHRWVLPAFGSHNIRSLCFAIEYARQLGLPPTAYELQSLYGMAEPIKSAFARRGLLVRDYAPIGELLPGMGYLVRRLLENTSNKGFIRQGFHEGETAQRLLAKPVLVTTDTGDAHTRVDYRQEFRNAPLRDFSLPEVRAELAAAIAQRRAQPVTVGPIVNGQNLPPVRSVAVVAPEDTAVALGQVGYASVAQAEAALKSLTAAFPAWRDTPIEARAEVLFKAADLMEQRRASLTAAIVWETAKPWAEADADVAEAIDFCRYYARQARLGLAPRKMNDLPGEDDTYFYEPRGVGVVIGPWNFPLAIPCGMLVALLVTGNCAVLKPAEQSSLIAGALVQLLREAGLPPGVVAFLPGQGEEIGPVLVESPLVSTIVFTGSKAVGFEILRRAAIVQPGQEHIKRVVAEMGGKNAIIVDGDADLDAAVKGILSSAFGFAGQKCSAASRLLVLAPVAERLRERLLDALRSLLVGPATNPAAAVPPLIEAAARQRLDEAIAGARRDKLEVIQAPIEATLLAQGHYVPPTIVWGVPAGHDLLRRELFGPLLAVVEVPDFDTALRLAMDSEYALTGAVFSRSPENLKRAAKEFRVGNLYLNRGSTGALVQRQPFGGARHSGVGSKAGGPDYLLQFVIPRALCENTLRQGFAPMEE